MCTKVFTIDIFCNLNKNTRAPSRHSSLATDIDFKSKFVLNITKWITRRWIRAEPKFGKHKCTFSESQVVNAWRLGLNAVIELSGL